MRTVVTFVLFGLLAQGAPKTAAKPAPKLTAEQRAAQAMLRSLNLHDRVAQLVIGVCYGDVPGSDTREFIKFRHWVKDLHIGGLIMNNRVQYGLVHNAEPHAMALFFNQMQKLSKTPLLIAGDFERGSSMRVSDTIRFPFNMAFGAARDVEASRHQGVATAREARALGVQWIFAPVADVNNNPQNPVINIRSYGENPEEVAQHVAAYIDGAHSDPKNVVLVSAKHFPGHGDTSIDSHLDLARVDASRDRMSEVELKPFQAAIEHQVDSIMTVHLTVPAIEPENIPATVSARVLTGLLREDLGFKGLVVTDAMDMAGLTKQFATGEASVRAIEAGADVLLMPPDPDAAIRAVLAAVASGRITRRRIDESVLRVLQAKVRVGLPKKKLVDLDAVSDALDSDDEAKRSQSVADRALTLVRNEGAVLPLAAPNQACLVVSARIRLSSFGQRLAEEFHRRAPQSRIVFIDNSLPMAALDAVTGDVSACSAVVFATFTTSPALGGDLAAYLEKLAASSTPVALVSFGSPYLLSGFPKVAAYMAAFSTATPSEVSVAKALLGEIAITGHMPVTIPDFAQYGEGIQLPAKTQSAPSAN